jgi:predicted esterase
VACGRAETRVSPRAASTNDAPSAMVASPTSADPTPAASVSPSAVTSARDDTPPLPPALAGEATIALEVPGFQPAVVAVPLGTRRPRPVAIALHGNFDRPEWQCGVWAPIVQNRGFVLCPRGIARRDVPKTMDRWEYASQKAVASEVEAALAALRARFDGHVAEGGVLFIGFSLGAIYGAPLVQRAPERFPRAVFIEGGLGAWTSRTAQRFVEAGGQRLILACGQPDCMAKGQRMVASLERAGLPTRHGGDGRAGHTYDGEVAQVVARNWDWLVEGDDRWQRESP